MRISDWSSDVCSSDLRAAAAERGGGRTRRPLPARPARPAGAVTQKFSTGLLDGEPWTGLGRSPIQHRADVTAAALRSGGFQVLFATGNRFGHRQFFNRSEERRVGKACVCTFSSTWSPYYLKHKSILY